VNQSFDPIKTPVGVFFKEVLLKRWDGIYFLVLTGVFAILTLFPSLPVFLATRFGFALHYKALDASHGIGYAFIILMLFIQYVRSFRDWVLPVWGNPLLFLYLSAWAYVPFHLMMEV
jgi:hypothetical protein